MYCILAGIFMSTDDLMQDNSQTTAIILPSIGGFLLSLSSLYWMTLFDSTSFYVTLFTESFKDIVSFMIVLITILASFAFGLMIVDHNLFK